MRMTHFLAALAALGPFAVLATGCKSVDCGDGTIERNGSCQAADQTTAAAKCGPFTELVGDQCVPQFPPTVCDDGTTEADPDPQTGVTTCIGTGGGGCSAPLACPSPAPGTQTICGQLFDFETGAAFAASSASGERCTAPAASGPCSIGIRAYDAIAFGSSPTTAEPLAVGDTYLDDCGRYRLSNVVVSAVGPFVGLGIDDAMMGPPGTTVTIGVALPKAADTASRGIEGFVAPLATTTKWQASGGPSLAGGIYAMVFRAASTGSALKAGVTATLMGNPIAGNDSYFAAGETTRATIDPAANATGANGTALVTAASVAQGVEYSGTSGDLPPSCTYSKHAGVALSGIVFIQVLRPIGAGCPL